MGLFLETAILKGSNVQEFSKVLPEVIAENPNMNLGSGNCLVKPSMGGISVLFPDGAVGYESLARALSEKLRRLVMLLYIYDGDQWGYYLYNNGRRLDEFNPVPDYFTDDESQTEQCKGDAKIIARHFGVSQQSIQSYLVRWTDALMESSGKAFPGDQFSYGDCWQMADFMNALGYPYTFAPNEEPTDALDSLPTEMPFDTALITTKLERWIADIYVIWSGREGGNWRLFGGYPKNEENAAVQQKLLERDWNIKSLADGIHTVNLLIADESHQSPATDGWDFCRGMQLIGVFYLVGFMDRAQMIDYSCTIGKTIQKHFKSWETLCESYLAGHAQWCQRTFTTDEIEKCIAERRGIYERYKKMKDGPYRLPWNMDLTKSKEAERGNTKQGAYTNYFDQWLAQEEEWIGAYRRKAARMTWLIGLAVMAIMAAFLIVMELLFNHGKTDLLISALLGVQVSLVIMVPFYLFVMYRLAKGRISKVIRKTTEMLQMDGCKIETLGMDMLDAIQTGSRHMDYEDKVPHSMTTPARLLVSKNYFYQTGTRMAVILIPRSDVDYIEVGQEYKWHNLSSNASQMFVLHAVYFYYRSSRGRRLEANKDPDNGMGFFEPAIRDRAFNMIKRLL